MRKLLAKDIYVVGKMIRKVLPKLMGMDFKEQPGEDKKDKAMRIGQECLPFIFDECFEDAWAWLADVSGCTIEEFDSKPLDFPVEVIGELIATEDMNLFLERVQKLMKKK